MAYEDFTTYSEVDPDSKLSITASKITWTDISRDDSATYTYKDYGTNHFNADFEFLFTTRPVSAAYDSAYWLMLLTNELVTAITTTYFGIYYNSLAAANLTLYENYGSTYTDASSVLTEGNILYPKWKRNESVGTYGTLYLYIYSDADRTVLVDTLSLTLHGKVDYKYITAFYLANSANTTNFTGYIENLDLQEPQSYSESASVIVGAVSSADRDVDYTRNASNLIGNLVSATKSYGTAITSLVVSGVAVSASRLLGYIRNVSNIIGNLVSASRLIEYTRNVSIIIGSVISAIKIANFPRAALIYIGDTISAICLLGFFRLSAISLGNVVSAAKNSASTRISSVINSVAVSASSHRIFSVSSSVIVGLTSTSSRLVGYIRGASNEIGVNNQIVSTIFVGAGAIDRSGASNNGWTIIDNENPANASGEISYVQFYVDNVVGYPLSDAKIGFFYNSDIGWCCRNYISIESFSEGLNTVAYNKNIESGDCIGWYCNNAYLERDLSGGTYKGKFGDWFDTPTSMGSASNVTWSLYGYNEIPMASRQVAYHRYPAIIEGITVSSSRVLSSARNAAIEIGAKISASKLFSYIRQSSVGQGIIVSASKAISIIRSSSIIAGIAATATGGKSYWKDASVIVGVVVSASRVFAFVRNAAVVAGIVVSASAIKRALKQLGTYVRFNTRNYSSIINNRGNRIIFVVRKYLARF